MTTSANDEDEMSVVELHAILEGMNVSPGVKRFMVARQWTLTETPPIASEAECEAYRLHRDAYAFTDPSVDPDGWAVWFKSPAGLRATALDARILEWEEADCTGAAFVSAKATVVQSRRLPALDRRLRHASSAAKILAR